ncbi:MAG: hypothetical protein NUW21_06390 [Elusimicrobia bacterium]|nr:hypothetical protein [Elusimicrobiota bacterium]
MAKKTAAPKKTAPKKKTALEVVIDYPAVHEIVMPGHYAIRLTAAGATQAQVRFDGDQWSDCREAAGHFWYDWAPQAGRVRLEARARIGKGRWSPTAELDAVVKPNEVSLVA